MRAWLTLLFPLIVWAFHFTGLYLTIEFLPGGSTAAALILTGTGIAALAGYWGLQRKLGGMAGTVAGCGALLSLIAIIAQCLPFVTSA